MKHWLEYQGLKGLVNFFALLPLDRGIRVGSALGRSWFAVDRRHRELAIDNISRGLGLSRDAAEVVAKRNFENLGRNLAEFAVWGKRRTGWEERVSIDNLDRFKQCQREGKGVFILSAHFGNWELGVMALSAKMALTNVVRPMKNPRTDTLINGWRRQSGTKLLGHRNSTRQILRILRRGEAIGILLDQKASRREGVFVEFLGRPANTNFGLALLAAKSGAPVLPVFIIREADQCHRMVFHEPVTLLRCADRQEELGRNTARFTAVIEKYVRTHPDQWFWVHNRWKHPPRPDEKVYRP